MTIERRHHEQETWVVDEFHVHVQCVDSYMNWGGIYPTYDEARDAGIAILAVHGTAGKSGQMKLEKVTRLATKEEVEQAQREAEITWADVEAGVAQVEADIEQVTGVSEYQRGLTGNPGPFSEYQRGYVAGVNSFTNILKGR